MLGLFFLVALVLFPFALILLIFVLIALILPAAMIRRERHWEPVTEFNSALFYVIKIVTLFTIAHTMTLSLAAFRVIDLPSRLVESVIAISIAIAAIDILFPIFKKKIAWVVFIFGLFHGFGFASGLSTTGMPRVELPWALLWFNIGVEIGQLAFVFLASALARSFKVLEIRWPRWALALPGYSVGSLGAYWTIQRTIILFGAL